MVSREHYHNPPYHNETAAAPPDMLSAALDYARRGWAVFPVWPIAEDTGSCACPKGPACGRNAGKHPLGLLVPNGVSDATTDEATIRQWWAVWPDANIAIATGTPSGVWVLDIDPDKGGWDSIDALEAAHGRVPTTLAVTTGGDGLHLYFELPDGTDVRNSAGAIAPGLDVRGTGGYVLAPPSLHLSGRRYAWSSLDDDA